MVLKSVEFSSMEMEMGGAGAVPKLDDPAEEEEEPWPASGRMPRSEKERCCRVLAIVCLVTLPLLVFFVLGRDSASTMWQLASAKLAAMNDGDAYEDDAGAGAGAGAGATSMADELLGGLLVPGMDRRSCRSRYHAPRYYKHFPFAPSPYLQQKLRAYEARHKKCAPGTPLYARSVEQLRSGRSAEAVECSYLVWLPFDGLGNRMLSMISGFLYALLTDRVLLVSLPEDSSDLFCEPFPNATWLHPRDEFPVDNLFGLGPYPEQSYTSLLERKKMVKNNATSTTTALPVPAYVYLSLGYQLADKLFFCGEDQVVLRKVNWLLQYSDLYFVPSLYSVPEFQGQLRRMFPAKESVAHLLARYLLHPTNSVWDMVTRYYQSHLAQATQRIGVQIRMFSFASIPVDDMYNQILACSRQEHILPETTDTTTNAGGKNGCTAIFIASLYADYYERLRAAYGEHAEAKGGARVGVFQRTHEERQATESLAHNQKALAEIYLLGFSEVLLTSGMSTFGYVGSSLAGVRPTILLPAHGHRVPETPCVRAVSMEPCNLTPAAREECRVKAADEEDVARHVKVCEDYQGGVKFFD